MFYTVDNFDLFDFSTFNFIVKYYWNFISKNRRFQCINVYNIISISIKYNVQYILYSIFEFSFFNSLLLNN